MNAVAGPMVSADFLKLRKKRGIDRTVTCEQLLDTSGELAARPGDGLFQAVEK